MSTSLGIYIENNLIKYAKLTKENNVIKVDSFNMKFYDKLEEALKQIIEETYSFRTPISINLTGEQYNYFKIFSLLNKKDIDSVINTEFESICYDNQKNKEAYETRYILVNDLEDKEKIKAIHVSANKSDLIKKTSNFEAGRVQAITPIGISISNLLEFNDNENVLIVNIEEKTTVTTIIDKNIYSVDSFDEGSQVILDRINLKENSYQKAYDICKQTTLYTSENTDLTFQENDYLDEIVPTLYEIAGKVRKIMNEAPKGIDKVYLTGTASVINNIDIYFQEYLKDAKCEILKPYFLNNLTTNVNIKDYIEVNSAIALAMEGIGEGIKEINFKKSSGWEKLKNAMTADVGGKSKKAGSSEAKVNIAMDFNEKLSGSEKIILRTLGGITLAFIAYIGCVSYVNGQIDLKQAEVEKVKTEQMAEISKTQSDSKKVNDRTADYAKLISNLEAMNKTIAENSNFKNAIPKLLNNVMYIIPKNVKLTSIQNTQGTHIVINAEAEQYEQLGYFKARLKTDNILANVVSDSAIKENGVVKVTIEGDMI